MKDQNSSQAKTEPPTPKRLRDLRKKGEVAKSPDFSATISIMVGISFFLLAGGYLTDRIRQVLNTAATADFRTLQDSQALQRWTAQMFAEVLWLTLPLIAVLVAIAAVSAFLQVGPVFSMEQVKPQLQRVSPIAGLKRLFSIRTVIEFCKLLVKAALLSAVIWFTALHALPVLLQSHWLPLEGVLPLAERLLKILSACAIAAFIAVAAFDLWFQKWEFLRRNRMSIEEVRREHKETEGDPLLRHRRRQLHREAVEASMLGGVRRANVVVVNPTHIAVALYYEAGETDLPIVVAKGEGELARAIRRIAEDEGIPIVHDVDLARRLRADTPVDQYIPEDLIEPVAAVLRWARDLQRPG